MSAIFSPSVRRNQGGLLAGRSFPSLGRAQAELDDWVHRYNTERPHQPLEMATPTERFRLAPVSVDAVWCRSMPPRNHAGQWVLRRVGSNGVVSVDNQVFSVGNAFKTELVDVFVDRPTIQVWSKNHLIKTVARTRTGPVRKVRANAFTSSISRTRSDKHQPELGRGTFAVRVGASGDER